MGDTLVWRYTRAAQNIPGASGSHILDRAQLPQLLGLGLREMHAWQAHQSVLQGLWLLYVVVPLATMEDTLQAQQLYL